MPAPNNKKEVYADMTDAGQSNIVFNASPHAGPMAVIRETDSFQVTWTAANAGPGDSPEFTDELIITNSDNSIVFQSEFQESPLPSGAGGSLMQAEVGPFPQSSYTLTVHLAKDLTPKTGTEGIIIQGATS